VKRVLLYTGDGKGKSTAAFGLALRAVGRGLRVFILQFIKRKSEVGECFALREFSQVELEQHGLGFVPPPDTSRFAAHVHAARQGLERVAAVGAEARHEVYILDEVCGAIGHGLLETAAVVAAVDGLPPDAIVVLTGRGAPDELVDLADTVTEMRCVKHGYDAGIQAQHGVED
jgi:cob(I)alamin adenosyltransferase